MKKRILWGIGGVAVIGILAFGYYTISPLFRSVVVNEEAPSGIPNERAAEGGSAQIVGSTGHPASGNVRVVSAGGKTYLRYENFKTINGPDLFIYLSNDLDAKEFVNIGELKATEGNVNYEVPAGVRVSDFRYALVWCRAFGVLFNFADLSAAQ